MRFFTFLTILLLTFSYSYSQSTSKPDMILLEGGTFRMGNDFTTNNDERPAHKVTVNPFYIGKHEVTNEQYGLFCLARGIKVPVGEKKQSVVNISWNDAVMYCNWLSSQEDLEPAYTIKRDSNKFIVVFNTSATGYRLPTEAEWEFAARGGLNSKHNAYSGSNVPDEVAWYINNAGNKQHTPGQKKPNELGLFDMTGNVMEWCYDWYNDKYYEKSEAENPIGPNSGVNRTCRGGNYMCRSEVLRNTKRFYLEPKNSGGLTGIRLVRNK